VRRKVGGGGGGQGALRLVPTDCCGRSAVGGVLWVSVRPLESSSSSPCPGTDCPLKQRASPCRLLPFQVLAGTYAPIPARLSIELSQLVAAMLQPDPKHVRGGGGGGGDGGCIICWVQLAMLQLPCNLPHGCRRRREDTSQPMQPLRCL
jgi:hypothetical protein